MSFRHCPPAENPATLLPQLQNELLSLLRTQLLAPDTSQARRTARLYFSVCRPLAEPKQALEGQPKYKHTPKEGSFKYKGLLRQKDRMFKLKWAVSLHFLWETAGHPHQVSRLMNRVVGLEKSAVFGVNSEPGAAA